VGRVRRGKTKAERISGETMGRGQKDRSAGEKPIKKEKKQIKATGWQSAAF